LTDSGVFSCLLLVDAEIPYLIGPAGLVTADHAALMRPAS
jgi:hypothetical protein